MYLLSFTFRTNTKESNRHANRTKQTQSEMYNTCIEYEKD